MKSDTELVEQANRGDATAFTQLLERHYDLIYRVAYRSLVKRQDAEDITQDICVALPGKLKSFQGKSKFTTWLYQITLNQCRDYFRKYAVKQKTQADFIHINTLKQAIDEEHKETLEWAYQAISSLSPPWHETAVLVVTEGLNHAEAAKVLGIKESTVSWRMMEVKKKLKAREQSATVS